MTFTAIIEKEENTYVSKCLELDIASQGATINEAIYNLKEAVLLFLESASEQEIKERLKDITVVSIEINKIIVE